MSVSQTNFRQALLDAAEPVPDGLCDAQGAPAGARFSVYRNNVVVSLKEAMETAFPLVRKLIGAENCSNVAGVFVRAHPPKSPLMMFYGADFPDFLDAFEPLAHLQYLSDCARLDLAMRRSYHASDSTPLDPQRLADAEALPTLRLRRAPHAQVLISRWPLFDLWQFNMVPGSAKPQPRAQDVLVARSNYDPVPNLLPAGAATWLAELDQGVPFAAAADATLASYPDFDLAAALTLALTTHCLLEAH